MSRATWFTTFCKRSRERNFDSLGATALLGSETRASGCIYCDGSVHDPEPQRLKDEQVRKQLHEHGYRVVVIRYDRDLEEQIQENADVFGEKGIQRSAPEPEFAEV